MYGIEQSSRTWIDYAGLVLAGALLLGLLGVGVYGTFTGFLQSVAYADANKVVAIIAGALGAGAALYLLLELAGRVTSRAVFVVCVLSGLFSMFAVTKSVPAAATMLQGRPASVSFTVTGFDWGGKNCGRSVVAKNAGYEDFRMCVTYLDRYPEVGDTIEVHGVGSAWGIARDRVRVMG